MLHQPHKCRAPRITGPQDRPRAEVGTKVACQGVINVAAIMVRVQCVMAGILRLHQVEICLTHSKRRLNCPCLHQHSQLTFNHHHHHLLHRAILLRKRSRRQHQAHSLLPMLICTFPHCVQFLCLLKRGLQLLRLCLSLSVQHAAQLQHSESSLCRRQQPHQHRLRSDRWLRFLCP